MNITIGVQASIVTTLALAPDEILTPRQMRFAAFEHMREMFKIAGPDDLIDSISILQVSTDEDQTIAAGYERRE